MTKGKLRFGIFTLAGENNYSVNEIGKEIQSRGHYAEKINPEDLYATISPTAGGQYDEVYRYREDNEGNDIEEKILKKNFDVIIPRIAGSGFEYGCILIEQLERHKGIFTTASSSGLRIAADKFLTAQRLSRNKVRTIKQAFARKPRNTEFVKNLVSDDGMLLCKTFRGSQGDGVFVLNGDLSIKTAFSTMNNSGIDIIAQKFVNSGEHKNDIRIWVIGAETNSPKMFAYRRYASESDVRSNYSLSHKGEKVEITEEEREMAINACLAIGLRVAGVDIIRDADDKNKPYIIEVNGNPGLLGAQTVTGENIAGALVEYCIDNYKRPTLVSDVNLLKDQYLSDNAKYWLYHYLGIYRGLNMLGSEKNAVRNEIRKFGVKQEIPQECLDELLTDFDKGGDRLSKIFKHFIWKGL
ncbi:MAG: ATP-grasp domain-containing protein [Bacteroidota bacterium]